MLVLPRNTESGFTCQAVYGALIPWASSVQSMITTMIILQLIMSTHKESIKGIRGVSLGILMRRVQRIYRVLDRAKTRRALLSYPTGERLNGAAFSLKCVY